MIILIDENCQIVGCYDDGNPMPTITNKESRTVDDKGQYMEAFYIDFDTEEIKEVQ